jgi:hypothetical protein
LEPPLTCNPIIKLWLDLSSNVVLKHPLFEPFKLVEISIVMVLNNMEDEQCFSIVSFMTFMLRNKLTNNFELVVKMFAQDQYSINTFPFGDAIKAW